VTTAYHYTTRDRALFIIGMEVIVPATASVNAGEKPLVWFSRNDRWEPTATKLIQYEGLPLRRATWEEMVRFEPVRFAVLAKTLIPWADIPSATGMKRRVAKELAEIGRVQGANPSHWMGSLDPVHLSSVLAIEQYVDGAWVPDPASELLHGSILQPIAEVVA